MTQVIINDILPRTQAIAIGGQTIYSTTWTAEVAADVIVYSRPALSTPNDAIDILLPSQFTVAFIGSQRIVQVTLLSPSAAGDVITITRDTPVDRLNLYTNTNFTPSMLNQDFGLNVLQIQENDMFNKRLTPKYPNSALINNFDIILPQLGPNESWVMNAAGNQILAQVAGSGGGGNISLNKFIVQTPDPSIPNAQALSALPSGVLKSASGTGIISVSTPLTSIDNLITIADQMIYTTAPNTYAVTAITAAARILLAQPTFAGIATVLGALPLAGGTMSGVIDMGNNKIINLTNPTNPQDAATKFYIDNQLTNFLPLSGGTMALNTGVINMNSSKIIGLEDPTNSQDAATKAYVDLVAIGLSVQQACFAATTTTSLNAIYNNGAGGIGATLTNNGALAAFTLDGTSPAANARILVKDQASTLQNGIYTLTTVGSGAVAWVLTRATDYDQPSEINAGDLIIITNGTVNGGTSWIETVTVTAIGVDPILFSQFTFSASQVLLKAANLSDVASKTASFNNISPSTTKGDLIVFDGVNNVRLPVGVINGQLLQVNSATATGLQYTTAIYPTTTTVNQLLFSSSTNTVVGLATANSAVLVTNQLGVPSLLGSLTNGQIVIGSTGSIPVINTISAGAGVAIVNGPGTITISATGSGSVNAGLINQLAFYAANGSTVSGLPTAANGVLVTDGSGVPSISTTLPTNIAVTTPRIVTGIKDANGANIIGFSPVASAVNYFNFTNAIATGTPIFSAIGSDTNITLSIQGKGTGGVDIKGVTSGADTAAGNVGEYVSGVLASGSAVALVNNTAKTVTSASLSAGDWHVWAELTVTGGATTQITRIIGAINTTTNALPATIPSDSASQTVIQPGITTTSVGVVWTPGGTGVPTMPVSPCRISSSGSTTVFLIASVAFTVSTASAYGKICARRVR